MNRSILILKSKTTNFPTRKGKAARIFLYLSNHFCLTNFTMKTLLLILIAFLLFGFSETQATNSIMLVTKDKDMNVALNNVCEYYAQVVICNGNSAAGIHPNLGILTCYL